MRTCTLFEHQEQYYASLGLSPSDETLTALERLNEQAGAELLEFGRRALRATQYVGVLRVPGLAVQVLPKIDYACQEPDHVNGGPNTAARNLLHLLDYARDLGIKAQDTAWLQDRARDWFEILTYLYAASLHRQLTLGAEHAYVRVDDDLPTIRGRWNVATQLLRRPHTKHRFEVTYDEFSPDTPLNRVFAVASRNLLRLTAERRNQALLREIGARLQEVALPLQLSAGHLDRVSFTRLNERFRPPFSLARLMLENRAYQLTVGNREGFSFVLDMNQLFEQFIAGFLTRHQARVLPSAWAEARVQVQAAGGTTCLAETLPEGRLVLHLRPDVRLCDPRNTSLLVLDTKYKPLDRSRPLHGISESDVYQMVIYAQRYRCDRVLVLYPQSERAPAQPLTLHVLGGSIHILFATINLQQPISPPDQLIAEMRALLQRCAAMGRKEAH